MTPQRPASMLEEKLAATWLARGVQPHARATLASLGELREFSAGTVVTRETELTEFLGVVLEGRLGLRLRVPERGPLTILTVEPGDVVGWSAIVPPFRATSTAVALTDVQLFCFDGQVLRVALGEDDSLAAQFYPSLLSAVARRLEGTRLQLLDLFGQRWVEPW